MKNISSPPSATRFSRLSTLVVGLTIAHVFASGQLVAEHPVSITRTHLYVTRERASATVEVFLEDLILFHVLEPNDADFLDPEVIAKGIELHRPFVANRFVLRDVSGNLVRPIGPVEGIEVTAEIPAEGVPLAESMAHRLSFRLEYVFDVPPEFLTLEQQFTDKDSILPSEMQLQIEQEAAGAPITTTLLPHAPYSVRLDWTRPPLSQEASAEQRKRWQEQQEGDTLGIVSYSSVYSFLYIEPREIRHEILVPLLTLEQSILLARDEDAFLDLAEQDAARAQIGAYFRTGNPILVDGEPREAAVQRCDFFGLDFKDFAQNAKPESVPLSSARVGLILSYPLTASPDTLQLTWDRFNQSLWAVTMVVFAGDDVSRTTLTRIAKKNVFHWESPGPATMPELSPVAVERSHTSPRRLPFLSISLIGASIVLWLGLRRLASVVRYGATAALMLAALLTWVCMPQEDDGLPHNLVSDVFQRVHSNMYAAFKFHGEDSAYDALGVSIHGDLLQTVYLQIQRGLRMQEQGGAVSRLADATIISGQRLESSPEGGGFVYRCRWNVSGTVEHWGHIHERTNQYEGLFTLEPIEGAWRVTAIELLGEERLQFHTRLRKL